MGAVPILSGKDVVRAFRSLGWSVARQRGSHVIMVKEGEIATLSVPNHKELAPGTLRSLVRAANLTMEQFIGATE
ncbi:MAG: type II toxin-antitoxin system HicA family toxin [Desulfomonilaceae bacterium]|nr:type II toxin-antitoxin system HicA family toxin [Desulfomonilaceae bacterium]